MSLKNKIKKAIFYILLILLITKVIIIMVNKNITSKDIIGIYVSLRNEKDSLFIIPTDNEFIFYYKRKIYDKIFYGEDTSSIKKDELHMFNWQYFYDDIDYSFTHVTFIFTNEYIYPLKVVKNLREVRLILTDPNSDLVEGYGFLKISDNVSEKTIEEISKHYYPKK